MNFLHLSLITFQVSFLAMSGPNIKYTIEDLESLEKNQEYREFLVHAKDIRPSQRKSLWQKMTSNMAESYVSKLLNENTIDKKEFEFINNLSTWPILKNNEFFMSRRALYAQQYFTKCFQKSKSPKLKRACMDDLFDFWATSLKSAKLAYNFGNLVMTYSNDLDLKYQAMSWDFFKIMALDKNSKDYCKKSAFQRPALEKLISLATYHRSKNQLVEAIDANFHENCLKLLTPLLVQTFSQKAHPAWPRAYEIIWAKNLVDSKQIDLYQVLYLLSKDQTKGDSLTEAWLKLVSLGQNYSRRVDVFNTLKSLDPLPGEIFAHKDSSISNTVIEHFADNMPEYLDFYAKTCLNYLSGKKTYENGNPTIECREFINKSAHKKWVKAPVLKKLLQFKL